MAHRYYLLFLFLSFSLIAGEWLTFDIVNVKFENNDEYWKIGKEIHSEDDLFLDCRSFLNSLEVRNHENEQLEFTYLYHEECMGMAEYLYEQQNQGIKTCLGWEPETNQIDLWHPSEDCR